MISNLNFRKTPLLLAFAAVLTFSVTTSCNKRDYPCPGLGKTNEADLSMFDDNGQLKSNKDKGRIDRGSGLVKKKKPKRLQAKRKTHL